jgi:threonine synthase
MKYLEGYRCSACGREIPAGSRAGECPVCSNPLLAVYDLGLMKRSVNRDDFLGDGPGVWRFRHLLPDFREMVTLGEGNTPLLRARNLGRLIGAGHLFIKDESRNPTGSFKARGMAVAVSRLKDIGAAIAYLPSAGNAGLALAAYGASAGLACVIFMPEETPEGVAEECRAYGARVEEVPGILPDAARRMSEEPIGERSAVLTTFREPCRVEGKKTVAFEIVTQCGPHAPDWILFPTGGGTGIVAIWKAYGELESLGWLEGPKPHLAVVQASGCAPLVRAFESGADSAEPCPDPVTVASGIRVPASRADRLILQALRESGGAAVAVPDEDIIAAVGEISANEGIFPSPEGAATWAGLRALIKAGTIDPASRIIIVNTAGGERYRFLLDGYRRGGKR